MPKIRLNQSAATSSPPAHCVELPEVVTPIHIAASARSNRLGPRAARQDRADSKHGDRTHYRRAASHDSSRPSTTSKSPSLYVQGSPLRRIAAGTVKALQPTVQTLKMLFGVSDNCCSFPGCEQIMCSPEWDAVMGEVCHICARSSGGPRYDPTQSDEERNGYGKKGEYVCFDRRSNPRA